MRSSAIRLDVVVNTRSGEPVTNLPEQAFTVLVNNSPRPITSFRRVTPAQEQVEVILLMDAIDIRYSDAVSMRDQTENFLHANGGKLAFPTTIAVLKDEGIQLATGFSKDGSKLGDALERYTIGLRSITQDAQGGENDRLGIGINALHQITTYAASLPGRKLIIWISPGYPLVSGPNINLTAHQQDQIFREVIGLSLQLRQADITLYDVNPLGVSESMSAANYYQTFLKGVGKPRDAQFADIGVQVLSVQTGGLTIESNTDVSGMIQRCLEDAASWYEISFDPPTADKPDQYRKIDVRLNQPGLVARTRTGYYANPVAVDPAH